MPKPNKAGASMRDKLRAQTNQSAKDRTGGSGWSVIDIGDGRTYRPEKGKNTIDIIPFVVREKFMAALLSRKGKPLGLAPGDWSYKLEIPVHRRVGANNRDFLCMRAAFDKKCPICEAAKGTTDEEDRKKLQPTWRVIYCVVDLKNEADGIQIFEQSHFLFEKKLLATAEEEGGEEVIVFADPEEGKTVKFSGVEDSYSGNKYLKFENFQFIDRKDGGYNEQSVEDAPSLDSMLRIPTYEEVSKAFLELDEDDIAPAAAGDDDDDDPPPKAKVAKPGRKAPAPVDDDDDDADDDDGASSDEDAGDDATDDDDDIPLEVAKSKRASVPVEDDDVDDDPLPKAKSAKPAKKPAPLKRGGMGNAQCKFGYQFGADTDLMDECPDCPNADYKACYAAKKGKK